MWAVRWIFFFNEVALREKSDNYQSFSIVFRIRVVTSPSDCFLLYLHELLCHCRWLHKVTTKMWGEKEAMLKSGWIYTFSSAHCCDSVAVVPVVNDICTAKSPFKHLCGKLVCVSQVSESNHIVFCFSIQYQSQRRNNFDPQPLCQKRGLFHIQFNELGLNMLFCQDGQVFVEDFTSKCRG